MAPSDIFVFLVIVLLVPDSEVDAAYPRNFLGNMIPLCKEKNPKLSECVLKPANMLISLLKNGIRELDFPPLDPMGIAKMDVGQERGTVYLKLQLTNTVHTGLSDLHFEHANMDMEGLVWTLNGTLPKYTLTGDYVGKGRILLLPLGGDGRANFTFQDLKIAIVMRGAMKNIGGDDHLGVKEVKVFIGFTPGKNYLDIQRRGDSVLADHTRKFLSENADEVFNSMKVTFEDVYTEIFTALLRRTFRKVPYKQMFKN